MLKGASKRCPLRKKISKILKKNTLGPSARRNLILGTPVAGESVRVAKDLAKPLVHPVRD